MADNYDRKRKADPTALPRVVPTVILAANLPAILPATAKCCEADADGTITVTAEDGTGTPVTYTVKANTPLPFIPPRVTAFTGPTKLTVF